MKNDDSKVYLTRFGINVRRIRKSIKMTQEDLASVTGFHRTYVSQIERGLTNPTLLNMHELATGLNVQVPMLIENIFDECFDAVFGDEVDCDAD